MRIYFLYIWTQFLIQNVCSYVFYYEIDFRRYLLLQKQWQIKFSNSFVSELGFCVYKYTKGVVGNSNNQWIIIICRHPNLMETTFVNCLRISQRKVNQICWQSVAFAVVFLYLFKNDNSKNSNNNNNNNIVKILKKIFESMLLATVHLGRSQMKLKSQTGWFHDFVTTEQVGLLIRGR